MSYAKKHPLAHGTLALSGGGGLEDTAELDAHFFSLLPSGAKILYIPVALKRDVQGYEACSVWFSTVLEKHASKRNMTYTMLLEDVEVPELTSYDMVYIGGGNTYKLLDYIKRKNLDSALMDFLHGGKAVYGGSAGAIVFGRDIRTVEEENDRAYLEHKGMDAMLGRSVVCHYNESVDEKILRTVERVQGDILALTESAGVLMHKGEEHLFGEAYLFTIDKKKNRLS